MLRDLWLLRMKNAPDFDFFSLLSSLPYLKLAIDEAKIWLIFSLFLMSFCFSSASDYSLDEAPDWLLLELRLGLLGY